MNSLLKRFAIWLFTKVISNAEQQALFLKKASEHPEPDYLYINLYKELLQHVDKSRIVPVNFEALAVRTISANNRYDELLHELTLRYLLNAFTSRPTYTAFVDQVRVIKSQKNQLSVIKQIRELLTENVLASNTAIYPEEIPYLVSVLALTNMVDHLASN